MELITAHELRHDLAMSQRMKKTQDKWLGWCNQYIDFTSLSGNNHVTIGKKVEFRIKKRNGNCINYSFREGVVFAISKEGNKIVVAYSGRLYTIRNEQADEQ